MKNLFRTITGVVLAGVLGCMPVEADGPVVSKKNASEKIEELSNKVRKKIGENIRYLEWRTRRIQEDGDILGPQKLVSSSLHIPGRSYQGFEYAGDKDFSFSFLYDGKIGESDFVFRMNAKSGHKGILKRVTDYVFRKDERLIAGLDDAGDRISLVSSERGRLSSLPNRERVAIMERYYLVELKKSMVSLLNERFLEKLVKQKSSFVGYLPQAQEIKSWNPLRRYNP
tara:strand:+ start:642 stop:1322 length:681 start_codon:yes stop_codon:yes gene_type:complete